jgi:hypothetical protein
MIEETSDKRVAGVLSSIKLGRRLQIEFPGIATVFRQSSSLAKVAEDFEIARTFGVSEGTAKDSIKRALRGYDGSWEGSYTLPYEGLISQEEYAELAQQHHCESPTNRRGEYGLKGVRTQEKRRTGLYGLTTQERIDASRSGVIALGRTPWSEEERQTVREESARLGHCRGYTSIVAEKVNQKYHGGKNVRTSIAILGYFASERRRSATKTILSIAGGRK